MNLLGGLGLFLLGMHLMTNGLKVSAGNALRRILAASAKTRMRGVLSGMFITSVVQSSSAVTVANIGFVNAGLLTLAEAVAITYGSNLGTTTTGWLVSIVGFHVNIKAFALPAIGIGMFLKLFSKNGRLSAMGEAMAGFGVFFLGIDMLKDGFSGLNGQVDLAAMAGSSLLHLAFFVGTGVMMTVLAQSSSAAIAITLTATGSGILPLEAAAAMVIGANIGTTSTALIASIGATPNAKRMATAHILFNVVTGCAALLLLPLLLAFVQILLGGLHLDSGPVMFLALFHTTFNILGIVLLWPFTDRMVNWLKGRFRAAEEDEAKPQYLDRTLVSTPGLALEALRHELSNIAGLAARMCKGVLSSEVRTPRQLEQDMRSIESLADAVGNYVGEMRRGELPEVVSNALPQAIGISRYYRDNAALAIAINQRAGVYVPEEVRELLSTFKHEAVAMIDAALALTEAEDQEKPHWEKDVLEHRYQELKTRILYAGTLGKAPVRQVIDLVELAKDIERIAKQMRKAANGLYLLHDVATNKPLSAEMDSEDDELQSHTEESNRDAEATSVSGSDGRAVEGDQ
jgi:phosphate:Na+ symporter